MTDRRGTHIRIRNFCFGPTILRTAPGDTVTWVNLDRFRHSVLGANATWGDYGSIRGPGGEVSYRFVRSGVYPYVCTFHPGMMGVVVVGSGRGPGVADAVTTSTGPVVLEQPSPATEPVAAVERPVAGSERSSWPTLAMWGIGVLLVSAAVLTIGRRRHAPAA